MRRPEQVMCVIAALAVPVSLAVYSPWDDARHSLPASTAGEGDAVRKAKESHEPENPDASGATANAKAANARGQPREAQDRNALWSGHGETDTPTLAGDLFTPPPLERDASGRLRVGAPVATDSPGHVAFGLSLLEVVQKPFRLQLVGYVEDPEGWIGVFENRITGRVFLARAPEDVPELDLRIESFAVERSRMEEPGRSTVATRAAQARVVDLRDGTTVELSSDKRHAGARPTARFVALAHGGTYDACPDGEFHVDGIRFRVAAISEQRVHLSRLKPDDQIESRWLQVDPGLRGPSDP